MTEDKFESLRVPLPTHEDPSVPIDPAKVPERVEPDEVPRRARDLIATGTRPDRDYDSRSEPLFAAICEFAKAGEPPEKALAAICSRDSPISASVFADASGKPRKNWQKYARRQVARAYGACGVGWPELSDDLMPRATYRNAIAAIKKLGLACSKDEFRDKCFVEGHPALTFAADGALTDDVLIALRKIIADKFSFDPGADHTKAAAGALCLEGRFHPILEYLDGLRWDGTPRLDTWTLDYLGCTDTEFNKAAGRLLLVAAVRRVRKPGTKFDQIAVLEGPEGKNKSTAVNILAGDEFFSDQTIIGLKDERVQEQLRGIWLYEIADLTGMSRAEVERVKAFASRRFDRARGAWKTVREDSGRTCVFFATTNDDKYLKSLTGNRRFWPLRTGTVDVDALARDRDQLWAEAARRESDGESIWLPEELYPAARAIQAERVERGGIYEAISNLAESDGWVVIGNEQRIPSRVLWAALHLQADRATQKTLNEISHAMRAHSWVGPKEQRYGKRHPIGKGWSRPVPQADLLAEEPSA